MAYLPCSSQGYQGLPRGHFHASQVNDSRYVLTSRAPPLQFDVFPKAHVEFFPCAKTWPAGCSPRSLSRHLHRSLREGFSPSHSHPLTLPPTLNPLLCGFTAAVLINKRQTPPPVPHRNGRRVATGVKERQMTVKCFSLEPGAVKPLRSKAGADSASAADLWPFITHG